MITNFLFLIFFQTYTHAQFSTNQLISYQKILQLDIKSAEILIKKEKKNNEITAYLQNYVIALQLLACQDDSIYQLTKNQEDINLESIKKATKKSPYYRFLQAEVKIQWALVKLTFGENFSAAWSIKQAYSLLAENEELYPNFLPNKKSLGILHIALGSVPEKYQWLLQLIGLEGDMAEGQKEMQAVIQSNSPFAFETQMLLMLAQTYILHEPEKALSVVQFGKEGYLFEFIYTLASMKAGKIVECTQNNTSNLEKQATDNLYSPLFDYLKGEICLLSGNYEQATEFYQLFLKNYKGKNYIKVAYYRLFLAAWLSNKPNAISYLDLCLKNGHTQIELDKNAQDFAQKKQFPNQLLMQARLLTDGGQYQKAWKIIGSHQIKDFEYQKDRIELLYRKARILDKQSKHIEAVDFYKQTISLSGNLPFYFAPNAALQLGYLYQNIFKDNKLAISYFKKVLTYPNHEYKSSIDHKAKTALKKI